MFIQNRWSFIFLLVFVYLACSAAALAEEVYPTAGGDTRVLEHTSYDYVPSIMWDQGKYRMWWCTDNGQHGDRIFYAESNDLQNWTNIQQVFMGRHEEHGCDVDSEFDCTDTCDPSVVKVDGTYYMYYGGFPVAADPGIQNKVGVAYSSDGFTWRRLNDGEPILVGNEEIPGYGAGHPSVLFLGEYFYMTYTDTSVDNGQHAIRSPDPTFQSDVQELRANGWYSLPAGTPPTSQYQYVTDTQNVDWAYIDSLQQFVLAIDGRDDTPEPGARDTRWVSFRFFDRDLSTQVKEVVDVASTWLEGPGLATYSNGHAIHNEDCSKVYLNVLRASDMEGSGQHYQDCWDNQFVEEPMVPWTSCWELGYVGWEYHTGLSSCPNVRFDYDGDSLSDQAVYRPTTPGEFYLHHAWVGDEIHELSQAKSTSIPIRGDFDGDGETDLGVATPNSSGYLNWTIQLSSGGTYSKSTWGLQTDYIAIGDYDGDGKADIGVFRPRVGTDWYIIRSSDQSAYTVNHGTTGDLPAQADFDGDGVTDLGVYRKSQSLYHIEYAAGGERYITWGDKYCVPYPYDFSGDGIADLSHYRKKNRKWYVKNYVTGAYFGKYAGVSGDEPIVGDFNGDGKGDLGVWRPSTGDWEILFQNWSQTIGSTTIQWGMPGDVLPKR